MKQPRFFATIFITFLLSFGGCASGDDKAVQFTQLTASEHKQVMDLLKHIYENGIGDRIVAWYETTARGYFDLPTRKMISFDEPIQTLSVAIPDYVAATTDISGKLEHSAKSISRDGWRLVDFHIGLEPHGAGGGPSGSFDKITIYPITVAKAGGVVGQSRESSSISRQDQGQNSRKSSSNSSACEILKRNIEETGSKYEGLQKTLEEVDGKDILGCTM